MKKKSVLITGGSQGLGEAIARHLADKDWRIFIFDIDPLGQQVAKSIGRDAVFIKGSVRDYRDLSHAVTQIVNIHGALDGVVANAGIVGTQVPLHKYSTDEWSKVIGVNLTGVFNTLKAALCQMVQQSSGGSIVNVASIAGFRGIVNLSPYTASKWAVRGLTQSVASEYADRHIRCNAVAPTAVNTKLLREYIASADNADAVRAKIIGQNALPSIPEPIDVARAVSFLLGDNANFITGTTLPVDAGALSRTPNSREDQAVVAKL